MSVEINNTNFWRFKKAYENAVRENKEQFKFLGADVLTSYAKYVVEYFETGRK